MTRQLTWDEEFENGVIEYARSYSGSFSFMNAMKDKAQDPKWKPTQRQFDAIVKCRAHDKGKAA